MAGHTDAAKRAGRSELGNTLVAQVMLRFLHFCILYFTRLRSVYLKMGFLSDCNLALWVINWMLRPEMLANGSVDLFHTNQL